MIETHADDEARRQIRDLLGDTFLVEAGAGTGKTSAMVDRVVALVLGGRAIDRIVAITFTEKAAAELRDRIRSALEERQQDAALSAEAAAGLARALESLDRAQFSTIHAFGGALVRQHAAELGVDPAFEVQDEVLADRRLEEEWRLYLDGLGADPGSAAVKAVNRALDLGLTTRDLARLAESLWRRPELAPLLAQKPLAAPRAAWPDLDASLTSLEALRLDRAADADPLRTRVERLIDLVARLRRSPGEREAYLAAGAGTLALRWGVSSAAAWGGGPAVTRVRDAARESATRLQATLDALRSEVLADLVPVAVDFVLKDGVARGREGRLVFDDLILRARDLLRDDPGARDSVRRRYDCLLIDEFQDTDPLQVEIAWSFAAGAESARPQPGRLFLVGDPKQSIYRFRRADMAVYSRTRRRVQAADGRTPLLVGNRRSRQVIIEWVNAVFRRLLGEEKDPDVQPAYQEISPTRDALLTGPGVAWFGDEMALAARDIRRIEAEAIARRLRAAVADGWQVQERGTEEVRAASSRDIAVLIPTRALLLPLERALSDAGIPYRVEGGSLVYGTQDVRDLINCLTAIDDPADEVAIVGALRSPAYACSDLEIAAFKIGGGRFNYLAPGLEQQQGRVAEALRGLRAFHLERHQRSLAALVETFVADRGLVEIGILDRGDRNTFRRVRFVVEQARAFEASGPESLRAFVSWLERRAVRAILDNEGAGLEDDEDAVRILTIHGAKGLEFPIVFLAGLGATVQSDRQVFGVDRATGETAVTIGAKTRGNEFTLGPVAAIAAVERRHLRAERDRLLYVAATRARDHIVVSLFHKQGTADAAARRLIDAGCRENAVELVAPAEARAPAAGALRSVAVELPYSSDDFEHRRTRLVAEARRVDYTSATALGARRAPGTEEKAEPADETEPWARGRGGTRPGRAVHAALQSVAWDADDAEVESVARAQAVAEAIPGRAAEVARLVRRALALPVAGRARSAGRVLREVPFAMTEDGRVVEGFIDAVVDDDGSIEIVDWKTDDVTTDEVESRLAAYRLQAGLYVLGLQRATGRLAARVTYVFIRPGIEASPGDPATLAAEALEVLRASK